MKRIWRIVVSLTLVLSLLISTTVQAATDINLLTFGVGYLSNKIEAEGDSVSLVTGGAYPRHHWDGEELKPGNALGNVRVYRIGVGMFGEGEHPLIVSPYKNWSKCKGCSLVTNGVTEDKLLRLHKGLAAYEQQNWVAVNTNAEHVVGVVYDKDYSADSEIADRVRDVVKSQDSKAKVVVSPARGPENYPGGAAVLFNENNMNVLFVNATKQSEFRDMCAETDNVTPVKIDNKDYVFNAAMLRALAGKSPEKIAKTLHIIGENQSLSEFKDEIGTQLRNILSAGHYTGIYLKAWNCSAITIDSFKVNGLEVANNPTVDVMGTLTALMCLYAYTHDAAYQSAINSYLEQLAIAMETKRKDTDMKWLSSQFACIAVEQLVPVNIQGKECCLSAPELMVAACEGTSNLATIRSRVLTTFCQHAQICIKNDCWEHFKAGVDISLSDAWAGDTIAEKYASMINWYHNKCMIKNCSTSCKETANGLIAAVQSSLGIKWRHNDDKLACRANVVMEEATGASGGETIYIHNEGTHDTKGKCFLSGVTTDGVNSMGGYGILSSTVSHEAKIAKPHAYGSFGVEVIKNSQADTKNPETAYKVRMDSNDTDKLADPFYVKATYKFAGEKKNDDVVDSLVDAIESTGGKWSTANVKVRFRMYANALPFTATSYKAPNYNKFAKWEDADSSKVKVESDPNKRKCTLKVLAPDGPKGIGAPGSQFKDEYTAMYTSLTKNKLKSLLKGGAVSWETQWCDVIGLNKTGARYFVYRIDADILYDIDGQTKTVKVEDTKDTFDKEHKCTARHFEYRKCAPDDGGWLKIYVSFKGSQYYDCTPPNLLANSFPKVAGKPCIVSSSLGWARDLAKAKYSQILPEDIYWEPTVEVKKLKKANGDKIETSGKIDIQIEQGMRIGGKRAKAPVAEIYLHAKQDPPSGSGGGGGGGGSKTSYTIQYYFNDEHDSSCDKTVNNQTIGSNATVTFPDESEHKEGFSFDKCEPVNGSDDHTAKINLKANGSENVIKAYYIETKFKYTSAIAKPYAEIKCGSLERGGSNEPYEAMAGFPTTEDMYFGSGGNETIADVEYEYKKNGKATRKYTFKNELPAANSQGTSHDLPEVFSYEDVPIAQAEAMFTAWCQSHDMHGAPGANKNGATNWTCAKCGSPFTSANWTHEHHEVRWNWLGESKTSTCSASLPAGTDSKGNTIYKTCGQSVTATIGPKSDAAEPDSPVTVTGCHGNSATATQKKAEATRWSGTFTFHPGTDSTTAVLEWTQDVEGFNYNQINKACVWGLTESLVKDTGKLTN